MSASIEAVSGAHSGGFRITAFPAASAGATRQVASIRGAFQGVITTVTPDGSHPTRSAKPVVVLHAGLQGEQLVGEEPEVASDPRHHRVPHRTQRGAVVARLDRRELGDARLDAVGDAMQHLGPLLRWHRAPHGTRRRAPRRPLDRPRRRPPRATSAIGCSSIGETSVNALGEPTRSPPIQCSVETSMPSTTARLVVLPSPVSEERSEGRSVSERYGGQGNLSSRIVREGGNRRRPGNRRSPRSSEVASHAEGSRHGTHPASGPSPRDRGPRDIVLVAGRGAALRVRRARRAERHDQPRPHHHARRLPPTASSTTSRRSSSPARARRSARSSRCPACPRRS